MSSASTPAGRQDNSVYEHAETIDSWDDTFYRPAARAHYDRAVAGLIRAMGVLPGQTVLDAGCGTGVHSIRAAQLGCRMRSVDISEAMLAKSRQNAERAGLEHPPEFEQQDLTNLTLPDNSVDHAFSWGVVIHIREMEKALAELVRVVKPGGSIGLQMTNASAVDHKLESVARALLPGRKPLDVVRSPFGPGFAWEWNGAEIFTWRIKADQLVRHMREAHNAVQTYRRISELTEIQHRLPGFLSTPIHLVNGLAYRVGLPAGLAVTQQFVFRTPPAAPASTEEGQAA
ncbi:MAG: methyltransferase domain-containing protein [Phycisphaerales bacterium]